MWTPFLRFDRYIPPKKTPIIRSPKNIETTAASERCGP
jgi:hypothetical protein